MTSDCIPIVTILALILLFCAAGPQMTAFAEDGDDVPRPLDTVAIAELDKKVSHHPGAEMPKHWITTPPAPMVIRKGEIAKTATYQEALGYTFMINSMKRPRLVRMHCGRLVLVATGWLNETGVEDGFIITSDDDGLTWTQPRPLMHGTVVNLGGDKLMIFGSQMIFSNDGGDTWSEPEPFPRQPGGGPCYHHGNVLVEGRTITGVFCGPDPMGTPWKQFLLRSHDSGRTWDPPHYMPEGWGSEGAITRAKDGALVVALRTGQAEGYPEYNDHWRRIRTARSTDDGKTWTDMQVYFKYGKVHSDLLTLPNGDILNVYATRIGELDGHVYHGIEAVLSHDHGKTWDWPNRYYLFRWAMMGSMHSPQSVLLGDGRVMTVLLYHYDAPWGKRILPAAQNIGLVDAIFWSPG